MQEEQTAVKMPPVRVAPELHAELTVIAGKLTSERKRRVTLGDVIAEATIALIEKRPELSPVEA